MSNITIEDQYVIEAKRIILEYDKVTLATNEVQKALNYSKNTILKYQNDLESLKGKTMPDKLKEQELYQIMTEYEKNINSMQNEIKPYLEQLESLKKSSHVLYGILKEKYPGATDLQLKTALNEALGKINV